MKFDNKYIKIKNGKKEITLHNYTYDRYLALFSKGQYSTNDEELDNINTEKDLYYCFIKFDNEIENIETAEKTDFDIFITQIVSTVTGNTNSVSVNYLYKDTNGNVYDLLNYEQTTLEQYVGRKITALGFGTNQIMSCVDTSNYNITILENEVLAIFREDLLTTDGEVVGNDIPLHLAPVSNKQIAIPDTTHYVPVYAKLYSIGLGTIKGQMLEEYVIGTDINIVIEDNFTFSFDLTKQISENEQKHPSKNLYTGASQYPLSANYNFITYKYRLYYYDTDMGGIVELDKYYTLSYNDYDTNGAFRIKTKIERRI